MNELALFAGAGGGILGGKLLGWRTVCAVEWEPYPASILCARQNDGLLPPFPIWDDIQTFDGHPWRGVVDVISGGFPCQDISAAGKGDGLDGERSGMWRHMARVVGEVRPRFVFVENSPMLTTRGGTRVIGDLTALGYDCRWTVMGAADVGANHQRNRMWIVAKWRGQLPHAQHDRIRWWEQQQEGAKKENGEMANSANSRQLRAERLENNSPSQRGWKSQDDVNQKGEISGKDSNSSCSYVERQWSIAIGIEQELRNIGDKSWWQSEPNVGRVADGVAARVDRLKAIGNGQVPLCAAEAWRLLSDQR